MPIADGSRLSWQATLRRHLAVLLLIKVAALALLWAVFFSPSHRPQIDPQAMSGRLASVPAP